MMPPRDTVSRGVVRALLVSTLLCLVFYGYRLQQLGEIAFSYLPWNLFLAWIPLGLVVVLMRLLHHYSWSDWPPLALTIIWVLFLPNSFYLVSDFIHLQEVSGPGVLYDVVMFTMFVFTGLLLGFSGLYWVHLELRRRMPVRLATWCIASLLLLCSVAIYIGRDLRWNSWDVLASPAGLLFDLSNRLLQPSLWGEMFSSVAIFFAMLAGMYYVGWQLLKVQRGLTPRDN